MSGCEVIDRRAGNAIHQDVARIAMRLRAAREERSLSPQDLAEQAGISEQVVRRMERGESDMGVLALARVARVLEKDLDWFVSGVRTLQEHTEALWCKHASVTRAYPADFRLPAKKNILVDLGLWEPIVQGAEKRSVIWLVKVAYR